MRSSIPRCLRTDTVDEAKRDLIEFLGWYITDDEGEPDTAAIESLVTDQVVEEWWRVAGNLCEQRDMLLRLGVDGWELDGWPEVWATLYGPSWKPNPAYYETEEGRRELQGERAAMGITRRPKVRVPSIPMSITECAEYLERSAKKRHPDAKPFYTPRRLRRMMDKGLVPFEKHSRESFTFCCAVYSGLPPRQGE